MSLPELILASRSPRRRDLLAEAGYEFRVMPAADHVEGGQCSGESPRDYVARLARDKATDVAARLDSGLVVGCDTVAVVDGQVLGKPLNEEHAEQMLRTLRGRQHFVYSGICLWDVGQRRHAVEVDVTKLHMDLLDEKQLGEYLASGDWEGKAGAFGYQDRHGWLHVLEGSESNVVGLPLERLQRMLADWQDES